MSSLEARRLARCDRTSAPILWSPKVQKGSRPAEFHLPAPSELRARLRSATHAHFLAIYIVSATQWSLVRIACHEPFLLEQDHEDKLLPVVECRQPAHEAGEYRSAPH